MNRTLAIIAIVVAAVLLALGMLFLCAATQEPARLLVAAPLLVAGVGSAAWGGIMLRGARNLDPENLSDRITQLARKGNAEVTLAQVVAELGVPDETAVAALNLLERRGQCRREHVGEDAREVYVFPGLKPSLVERRCPYCGAEFSVKEAVYKCPNCGGDLRLERE
jgi:Zn finger protein HypA/HybF involved in hydrogenase expression